MQRIYRNRNHLFHHQMESSRDLVEQIMFVLYI